MTENTRPTGMPRMTYAESIFFDDTMLGHIGVISGLKQFGKRYLAAENFMSHLDEVLEAIKQDFIINRNTREVCKFQFNPEIVLKCKQVWHTNTFVGIFRDPRNPAKIRERRFYFSQEEIRKDIEKGNQPSEIETNPALKKMKPRRPPNTNPLWVEIRESVKMKYAWEGYNVKDLALIGNFVYNFKNVRQPRFTSQSELSNPLYKTRFVSKNYFDIKMDLLFSRWTPLANIIYINWKRIIMETKVHGKLSDETEHYQEDTDLE